MVQLKKFNERIFASGALAMRLPAAIMAENFITEFAVVRPGVERSGGNYLFQRHYGTNDPRGFFLILFTLLNCCVSFSPRIYVFRGRPAQTPCQLSGLDRL